MLAGSENPYVTFHTDNFGPPRSSRCQPEQIKCSISIKGVNEIAPPSAFTLMNTFRRETLCIYGHLNMVSPSHVDMVVHKDLHCHSLSHPLPIND